MLLRHSLSLMFAFALAGLLAGCVENAQPPVTPGPTKGGTSENPKPMEKLSGSISISGSSTVFPISQKVAVAFREMQPDVSTEVGENGTSSGFQQFFKGDLDIVDASRPITEKELAICKEKNIEMVGFTIAIDGLTVVVNAKNDWCECLTVAELKKIWDQESSVKSWKDVREGFPDQPIKLFGPGMKSGTFDFFSEKVNGKSKQHRTDYSQNENDNLLVKGVETNVPGMGYFGYSYYADNKSILKAVAIKKDADSPCIAPSAETVLDGSYFLSRPVFIYTSTEKLKRPEIAAFIRYYLTDGLKHVEEAKYFRAPEATRQEMVKKFEELTAAK